MKIFVIICSILCMTWNIFSQVNPDLRNEVTEKLNHPPIDNNQSTENYFTNTGYWTEVNPRVPRVNYYGVYIQSKNTCFAVGEYGSIIRSTDGGISWDDESYTTAKTLLRISGYGNFIVAAGVNIILKSTDYGETWDSADVNLGTTFWGVQVFDDSICYISGRNGEFLKTFNAGNSWIIDTVDFPLIYWDLKFDDRDTGFISCSNGMILRTTDSGTSWVAIQTGDLNSIYSIEILPNKNIVTAGSSGKIYYSTDFGNTFLESIVPIQFVVEDLAFADNNIGFAVGQATVTNGVNKTTDGGLTWNLLNMQMGNLNIDFVSDSVAYNVGMDLRLYKSSDKGDHWDKLIINDNFVSISAVNDNSVFLLGPIALYRYSNNQIFKISSTTAGSGGTVYFTSDSVGYYAASDAHLFRTTNGGYNWIKVDSSTVLTSSNSIQFTDNIGFYLTANYLKKSTNNGINWVQITNGSSFRSFFFLDSLRGWISGDNLYKTSDGGLNWEIINSIPYQDISFVDPDTGYAIAGSLYKTTDGGYTWNIINGITGRYLEVVDTSMIITMSEQGKNFISWDYGTTWGEYILPGLGKGINFISKAQGYYLGTLGLFFSYFDSTYVPVELINFSGCIETNNIVLYWSTASELNNIGFEIQKKLEDSWRGIGFLNGNGTTTSRNAYVFSDSNPLIGDNNYRLKQIDFNGQYTFSREISIKFLPLSPFKLYPNYPNPFNSQTTLVFYLPVRATITIKIFNVLGEKVDQIILPNLEPGLNQLVYSANHLNSGVYFYTASYSTSEQRGKMLLVK